MCLPDRGTTIYPRERIVSLDVGTGLYICKLLVTNYYVGMISLDLSSERERERERVFAPSFRSRLLLLFLAQFLPGKIARRIRGIDGIVSRTIVEFSRIAISANRDCGKFELTYNRELYGLHFFFFFLTKYKDVGEEESVFEREEIRGRGKKGKRKKRTTSRA